MFSPPPIHDNRRLAKFLYWQGWAVTDLADYLGEPRTTVQSWKTRDTWDQAPAIERVETTLEARMVQLIAKDQKTGGDYKEIDLLGRQIERLARVRRYDAGGNECDLNPKIQDRAKASGRKPAKNELTPEHCEKLVHAFRDSLFGYQDRWLAACDERTRMILKSRQIGATWYFASAEHKALFAADPERYLPAYGGFCAYGTSRGYLVKIEPEAWSIVDGKLYLNYDLGVRTTWLRDRAKYIGRADRNWPRLSTMP